MAAQPPAAERASATLQQCQQSLRMQHCSRVRKQQQRLMHRRQQHSQRPSWLLLLLRRLVLVARQGAALAQILFW
jgi:hypothetical protein